MRRTVGAMQFTSSRVGRIVAGWEILRGFEPPLSQLLFAVSKLNDTLLQSMQITFATLYDVDPL